MAYVLCQMNGLLLPNEWLIMPNEWLIMPNEWLIMPNEWLSINDWLINTELLLAIRLYQRNNNPPIKNMIHLHERRCIINDRIPRR